MGTFFAEVRRRNIFRVGVAYAVLAWLLIQVAETILPTFDTPRWFLQTFIVLLILGFPLALFLAWVYELTPEGVKAATSEGPAQYHTRTTGQRLNYFIVGVLVLAVAFLFVDRYLSERAPGMAATSQPAMIETGAEIASPSSGGPQASKPFASSDLPIRRLSLILGQTQPFPTSRLNAYVAMSRDGRQLLYTINTTDGYQLYHRPLDQISARIIPGTGNAFDMFFSPDGEWVAYFTTPSDLYKVAIVGGPPQQLAEGVSLGAGGAWSSDGVIYFSVNNKLHRIGAAGGTPEPVTIQSEFAGWNQSRPSVLPDGKHLLFTVSLGDARDGSVALLNLETGAAETIIRNGYNARYVPTGHIVFMRSASLWAVPFEAGRLETKGTEVPVVNGVQTAGDAGIAAYDFSDNGLLAYLPGIDVQSMDVANVKLAWVDREGHESLLDAAVQDYQIPQISPDGRQVALRITTQGTPDIWTYDFNRGTLSRRTFTGATAPLWTPDGKRLVYTHFPPYQGLTWMNADGTGQPEKLIDAARLLIPASFTPDGSQLLFFEATTGPNDIYALSMTGDRNETPVLTTAFSELFPVLSPDGRWLAYQSNETGRPEIYVRPYPQVDAGKWQVSTDGGTKPRWRGDGRELFYRRQAGPESTIVAVTIDTTPVFRPGIPVELFTGEYAARTGMDYDVAADGERFLMLEVVEVEPADIVSRLTHLVVVENWFEELMRLAPPTK